MRLKKIGSAIFIYLCWTIINFSYYINIMGSIQVFTSDQQIFKINFRVPPINLEAEALFNFHLEPILQIPPIFNIHPWSSSSTDDRDAFSAFLGAIKSQIINSRQIYGQFLQIKEILEMLNIFQICYVNQSIGVEIVHLVLDFLSYCKNCAGCQPSLKSTFTGEYPKELAERWMRYREEIYKFNKGQLKILSYIVEEQRSKENQNKSCFQSLQFNLSEVESYKVAAEAFTMAKEDVRSFIFLSNYLLMSCKNLEKKKVPLRDIKKQLSKIISNLDRKYKPAPKIKAEKSHFMKHQNEFHQDLIPKENEISLMGRPDPEEALNNFIKERAKEAESQKKRFIALMKNICHQNDGFRFKADVKVKETNMERALLRVKEKMIKDIYGKVEIQSKLNVADIGSSQTIDGQISRQKEAFKQKMAAIFETRKKPIPYKVDDMLRGKCHFADISKINQCCTDILQALKKEENADLKLIKLDNRLDNSTSDLVLKILFGKTIAQLQLVINLSSAENQFNHRLYQLIRSKHFSPLTQLSILNYDLCWEYLTEILLIIKANTKIKQDQTFYEEATTYAAVQGNFKNFLAMLPVKIDCQLSSTTEKNIDMLSEQQRYFKDILECKIANKIHEDFVKRKIKEGQYLYYVKQYGKMEIVLEEAECYLKKEMNNRHRSQEEQSWSEEQILRICHLKGQMQCYKGNYAGAIEYFKKCIEEAESINDIESINIATTHNSIGSTYGKQCNYSKALEHFQRSLQIKTKILGVENIEVASIYNNIGNIYKDQQEHQKAIEFFTKCLQIQKKIKGKDSIETASSLLNLGSVYCAQHNYLKGIEHYQRCLQIQQKTYGYGCIDIAFTLNNMGLIYELQGNFTKAIDYYFRSLAIQQRIMGKSSFDTVKALNNIGKIYIQQGDIPKAIQYFFQSLEIQERINGKDSIGIASTLNNIGLIYTNLGDYTQAIKYYSKSLQINQKVKGKGSLDASSDLNNIGYIYCMQKKYSQALDYYSKSLKIKETAIGVDPLEISLTLANIGGVHIEQRDYQMALKYLLRSLQIEESIKERSTPNTASILNTIGSVYNNMGDYSMALEYYLRSLQMQEKVNGKGSTNAASILSTIESIYKNPKAIDHFRKSLSISKQKGIIHKGKNNPAKNLYLCQIIRNRSLYFEHYGS